jgi:hypothetical protein
MVYEQENISKYKFKRVFTENVDSEELVWHRDTSDRKVFVEQSNGWMLQMDEELPQVLQEGQTYIIPKMVYHRVIKGTGNLKITVDEGFNKFRVPKVVRESVKKNLYRIKKSGVNMRIATTLLENQYVSREILEEIKSFCDKSYITESRNPKDEKENITYLSYGGIKGYEWVIHSLL